ncbi:MAG TPA: TolC family protein [Candidatus Limnocylindrales bacterium]|jgi:outer membrane protein|nr:TolC family protein [Candidatus Limnocylindrales bacterium]
MKLVRATLGNSLRRFSLIVSALSVVFWAELARTEEVQALTLQQAHETAIKNHPLITIADLKALASREVVTQVRSGFFPNISANAVAVGTASDNTRLEAIGALNNPSIFDRQAEGVMISQLITDFGRTANLTGSAKLQAQAAANNAQATREQILLAVDGAFYAAQQAQAVTRVARQTVTARQTFLDQVSALASNKLRSELDVSFARVNVEEAQLLLSKAQNDLNASFAQLSNLLGLRDSKQYHLIDEPLPPELSNNVSDFTQRALQFRPDLLSLRNQQEAALKLAKAQRDARFPTISAVGSAGGAPIHDSALPDGYAAAGLIINVPIFAGGFYVARQREAELQAQAAEASLRNLEDNVTRDVRIAWLNAQNAFDRYRITGRLLENARQSYNLAKTRYQNGLSSIAEFNQAELNLISAEISLATTQYEYLVQRSALSFQTGALR